MQRDQVQLLIVGGGIVGAGVARDAALRGIDLLLVEQHDFASGTSSRSSRLLHGGLRYLAQGRIGLVREAGREKRILQRIAPHLYRPLRFVFPTRPTGAWRRWKLGLGVRLYWLLCGGQPPAVLGRRELREQLPSLAKDVDWTGGVAYEDALTNDARLVLDTLRSAEQAGAKLRSYTRLVDARRDGDHWLCRLAPAGQADGHEFEVRAQCVVNATGPWCGQQAPSQTELRLTKGVHLVVSGRRMPLSAAVVMTEKDRILFAIPWGERVILGTTDTDYDGPLEAPACGHEDMRYVLAVVNRTFDVRLTPEDVTSAWAGIRALLPSKGRPSQISRRHRIDMCQPGWFDVTGGKLTTYRAMAEQTVDQIQGVLGTKFRDCQTADRELLPVEQRQFSGWRPPAVCREAVEHYCSEEWATHLSDVMIRRSGWHTYCDARMDVAAEVLQWMGGLLQWSDQRRQAEWRAYETSAAAEVPRAGG